jgi:hypothetical protein
VRRRLWRSGWVICYRFAMSVGLVISMVGVRVLAGRGDGVYHFVEGRLVDGVEDVDDDGEEEDYGEGGRGHGL